MCKKNAKMSEKNFLAKGGCVEGNKMMQKKHNRPIFCANFIHFWQKTKPYLFNMI